VGNDSIEKAVYRGIALPLAYAAVRAAAPFHAKLRRAVRGREGVKDRWAEAAARLGARPVWFHVASVGEYEQARPIITALGATRPGVPVALSVTSPSGYDYISGKEKIDGGNNVRFVDYLPFDFARNARFCVETLDPRLLVFVKFDLWPNLVWEAAGRGTPVVLVDATLSEASRRNSGAGKRFYRTVYSRLDKILAISDSDARRFVECAPGHPGVSVVGDTRFDRVMERKRLRTGPKPVIHKDGRITIIAGSTWPKDEAHVLGALSKLARSRADVLLVLAPHEPAPERVQALLSWARGEGLAASPLSRHERSAGGPPAERVVVVDSVGVLAEIYEYGDAAYIGGSFSTGVHNVIEPAVMGIPVVFGPVHKNSFEAIELLRYGAAVVAANGTDIFRALESWAADTRKRLEMGGNARRYVESQLGATERCVEAIREYL
jgi:3-deoxy-D-manno-octulosonic-acid transferase